GTSCGTGLVCDGNGNCVGCNQASDCGANTACRTWACNAGMCSPTNAPMGTFVPDPTMGDCHSMQCDANGNIVNTVDNGDKPNDGKQCTNDVCTNGAPSNPPLVVGTMCT